MRNIVSPLDGIRSPFGPPFGFNPLKLFALGEQGAWYDPSDLSTMFQNSAGTTPVTAVEQPVGLLLDKSKRLALGAEIISVAADRDFSSDTGFWTKTIGVTISGGQCVYTSVSSLGGLYRTGLLTAGIYYEITFTISSITAGAIRLYVGGNSTGNITTAGTYTERIVAGSVDTYLIFENFGTTTLTLDNVSIKPVTGNHARQSTAASRPVLSARVNLLTYTEQFDNAYWAKFALLAFGSGSIVNATTAPDGTLTADLIASNTTSNYHGVGTVAGVTIAASTNHTLIIYVKKGTIRYFGYGVDASAVAYAGAAFDIDTLTATATAGGAGYAASSASITPVGDDWYRASVIVSTPGTTFPEFYFRRNAFASGFFGEIYTGSTSDTLYIWGADLRVTNVGVGIPAYQRVGAAVTGTTNPAVTGVPDYDTSGFPLYLKFDGTDDSLATASIDFSATDKMSVFAGARKLSDTAAGVIAELSNDVGNNSGAFNILASTSIGDGARRTWGGQLRGTVNNSFGGPTYSSPISAVITQKLDIAGAAAANEIIQLVNGSATTLTFNGADSGTGNFGNYPLYIGRRDNASVPFNGHLYSLIVRGALSTDAQIASTETYVNNLTKAY